MYKVTKDCMAATIFPLFSVFFTLVMSYFGFSYVISVKGYDY